MTSSSSQTLAAASLMQLAHGHTAQDTERCCTTPPRASTKAIKSIEYESPDRTNFNCTGTKRPRKDIVLVLYENEKHAVSVPFIRGEDPSLFFQRRSLITKATVEANIRNVVYCTWRKTLLSILTNDSRWHMIRDSPQQKPLCVQEYPARRLTLHLHPVERKCPMS